MRGASLITVVIAQAFTTATLLQGIRAMIAIYLSGLILV
mgnify:CR=1 FL=1